MLASNLASLLIIATTCGGILFTSLRRTQGVYTLPFHFSAVSLLMLGVQLALLCKAKGADYTAEIADFTLLLAMSNVAVFFGFRYGAKTKTQPLQYRATASENVDSTRRRAYVITAASVAGFIMLAQLAGGPENYIEQEGRGLVWEGAAVQYVFFAQLAYFTLAVAAAAWAKSGGLRNLVLLCATSFIPVINATLLMRRFALFYLGTVAALTFYYRTRRGISRLPAAGAMICGMIVITLFPAARAEQSLDEELRRRDLSGAELVTGNHYGEVLNGCLVIGSTRSRGELGLGSGFVLQALRDFIPSSTIGRRSKTALVRRFSPRSRVFEEYGYRIPPHEFITGTAWLYREFGAMSILLWAVLGYYMGTLWRRAQLAADLATHAAYIIMLSTSLMALYYSPGAAMTFALKGILVVRVCCSKGRRRNESETLRPTRHQRT